MSTQFPTARKDKLVVRELGDEVLIYDLIRNRAFCLNKTAAAVWKESNGEKTVRQIAAELSAQCKTTIDDKVVWIALEQLGQDHLLETRVSVPAGISGVTRREQLRSLGKAAAIATPLVTALTAPLAAQTNTCLAQFQGPCNSMTNCCSGRGNCFTNGTHVGTCK